MYEFSHWQPVLRSIDLGTEPKRVEILGQSLAIFRPEEGGVSAISDVCPHRRMSLSVGRVLGDCLECCYHGWTFDGEGNGESPGTPKMRARIDSFETRESHGLIWLRSRNSNTAFPRFDGSEMNYRLMTQLIHDIEAPVECVLDNFTELEHTPTTHGMFGFQLNRMHEVEVEVEPAEDQVAIRYRGPSKTYPWLSRTFLRLSRHTIFNMRGGVKYSPIFVWGDYHWTDEATGRRSPIGVRNVHFFTPLSAARTRVVTMSYMRSDDPVRARLLGIARPIVRATINREVLEDKRVLDGLADKSPGIAGLKLSRFDRVVGLHRDRIDRIYRGKPGGDCSGNGSTGGERMFLPGNSDAAGSALSDQNTPS